MLAQPQRKIVLIFVLTILVSWLCNPTTNGLGWVVRAMGQDQHRLASFVMAADKFSEKVATVLNHLAREDFGKAKEFQLVDLRSRFEKGGKDRRLAVLRKARKLLVSGKAHYDNLELDASIEDLKGSISRFHKAVGRLGLGEQYLEALLYLGAAYILSGDSQRGMQCFKQVIMYDQKKAIDPRVFPPSMTQMFNQVKQDVSALPKGRLSVKSNPAAAELYLNGVFKGVTPITLVELPQGAHFVRVEKDGYLSWGQRIHVSASRENTSEAVLREGPKLPRLLELNESLLVGLGEDPPAQSLIRFGQWLKADRLVVAVARQRGSQVLMEAAMIQVQPAKTLAIRRAEFDLTGKEFAGRAAAYFTSLYRKIEPPPIEQPVEVAPLPEVAGIRCHSDSDCGSGEICHSDSGRCISEAPERPAIYEKWWFWTIVGAGLVVVGGTTALVWHLLQSREGAIEFTF